MLRSTYLLISLLILLSAFSGQKSKPEITRWVIMKGGSLRVDGSTNVNKFKCDISSNAKSDTVNIYKSSGKNPVQLSGSLVLDVQNFDCHNPVMTSDLRKTLKAKTHPKLVIRFLNLSRYPDLDGQQENIRGAVTIELAGVTKRFDVDYRFLSSNQNVINLIARRQVNFTDFDIVPPRKIGGMIQTDNELDVTFNLRIKVLD